MIVAALAGAAAFVGCGDSGTDESSDPATSSPVEDRVRFVAESDGVRAVVADCFVVESTDGGRRYQTTVEVTNGSDSAADVTVVIDADLGRGGTSAAVEMTPGGTDAWAVTSDDVTSDPVGDVDCDTYVRGIEVTLD